MAAAFLRLLGTESRRLTVACEHDAELRQKGVLRKLSTTPITRAEWILSNILYQLILAVISTAAILIVAWLAKLNPLAAILVSILFGALLLAGREIQPSGIPKMIQGIILVCLIASDFFMRYRILVVRPEEEA
jgi:hypothetical protein